MMCSPFVLHIQIDVNTEKKKGHESLSLFISASDYCNLRSSADEMHALALGRSIIKNLHLAGKDGLINGLQNINQDFKEPLYDVRELRSIAPTDHKQSFDIRSVIARIVDGSEFDEFKKLYGTVSTFISLKIAYFFICSFLIFLNLTILIVWIADFNYRLCQNFWSACRNYWKQWDIV